MAAVKVSTLRARIATAVDAVTGFSEAKAPYGMFLRDPATTLHKRFAVGPGSSDPPPSRQRVSEDLPVSTQFAIAYAFRLAPKDLVTSLDDALDAEQDIIQAVMAQNTTLWANATITYAAVAKREVTAIGEWYTGEIRLTVNHAIPLS